jgi:hypothetical protein
MAHNLFRSSLTVALLLLSTSLSATANDTACQSDWLPLQTGNYWVYRVDSRFTTGSHQTLRVLGPYEFEDKIWCQLEDASTNYLVRVDTEGRIYRRYFNSNIEELLLDPRNLLPREYASPLGFTSLVIDYSTNSSLLMNRSSFVKGIGRISTTTNVMAGSSGGFSYSETLLEASINGKLYKLPATNAPSVHLELAPEFRNCAVPCYYAACGLGSPVDPPNANKPCLAARLSATNLSPGSSLLLTLSNSIGTLQYSQQIPLSNTQPVLYQSLSFYNQTSTGSPITLFPKGDYFVTLTALNPDAQPLSTTSSRTTLK